MTEATDCYLLPAIRSLDACKGAVNEYRWQCLSYQLIHCFKSARILIAYSVLEENHQLGDYQPQLWGLPNHLAVMSLIARNSSLKSESSAGNTVLVLVTFLSCLLKPSMALAV